LAGAPKELLLRFVLATTKDGYALTSTPPPNLAKRLKVGSGTFSEAKRRLPAKKAKTKSKPINSIFIDFINYKTPKNE
jgi:hypothetical protein